MSLALASTYFAAPYKPPPLGLGHCSSLGSDDSNQKPRGFCLKMAFEQEISYHLFLLRVTTPSKDAQ
jgi:hypothetical protein